MPKRKARKSLFSSDDARRKRRVLSLRLKTNGVNGCVLRGKGWLFQELRILKNVAAYYKGKDGISSSQDTEERRYSLIAVSAYAYVAYFCYVATLFIFKSSVVRICLFSHYDAMLLHHCAYV